MKLGKCQVTNFGSYASLELDFANIGLGLIYGKTGSGKSTIPDLSAWILYGVTAKDGNADDVRSWQTPDEPTTGVLEVELPDGVITVTRIRGAKAGQNDLYWTEIEASDSDPKRGKDLADTQKRLSARLGVDSDTYLSGSYFHEFSPAGGFFTAKAKDRREIFEKIASLDLPARLAKEASEARKEVKAGITKTTAALNQAQGALTQINASIARTEADIAAWKPKQAAWIKSLEDKAANFEADKAYRCLVLAKEADKFQETRYTSLHAITSQVERLSDRISKIEAALPGLGDLKANLERLEAETCNACGGPKNTEEAKKIRKEISALERLAQDKRLAESQVDTFLSQADRLSAEENPYLAKIEVEKACVNNYLEQIDRAKAEECPYNIDDLEQQAYLKSEEAESLSGDLEGLENRCTALDQLYDLSSNLRGELLRKAVREIQDSTNRIIETYFDAEIRVEFRLAGADSLDVEIQKSGYPCVYKQLSKGQRQLLKIGFVVSIMKASANKAGVHFDSIFFDEALDGLDNDLKVKAFSLFSELETEHGTVLLIDHAPDFQSLFSRRYFVAMTSDRSEITDESENH